MNQPEVTPAGILFGPNASGKSYLSINSHRGHRPHKNMWDQSITRTEEHALFCLADQGNWQDSDGHFWGVLDQGTTTLGCKGEKISKFPFNAQVNTPWHGYPVSPLLDGEEGNQPPDEFVERWIQENIVSLTIGRRIQRGKV